MNVVNTPFLRCLVRKEGGEESRVLSDALSSVSEDVCQKSIFPPHSGTLTPWFFRPDDELCHALPLGSVDVDDNIFTSRRSLPIASHLT